MAEDISRKTENIIFDKELSSEIISNAIDDSAFMQLAPRMSIAGAGKKFQTITGDPEPEWVGETEKKPVGTFKYGKKEVMPYKMALIVPFSDEFRRDKQAIYDESVKRLPKLFGQKFDRTIMGTTAPGEGFDVLGGATKVSLNPAQGGTVYGQFIAIDAAISAANGIMSGIALAPQGKSKVLAAVDNTGRPLFTPGVGANTVGNILGANVQVKKGVFVQGDASNPSTVGIAGDFDAVAWGAVNSITGSISTEASIEDANGETLHLWQRNMFAVRYEIELAFMVRDINKFVLLTGDTVAGE